MKWSYKFCLLRKTFCNAMKYEFTCKLVSIAHRCVSTRVLAVRLSGLQLERKAAASLVLTTAAVVAERHRKCRQESGASDELHTESGREPNGICCHDATLDEEKQQSKRVTQVARIGGCKPECLQNQKRKVTARKISRSCRFPTVAYRFAACTLCTSQMQHHAL